MKEHTVNATEKPTERCVAIRCSCGWEKDVKVAYTTSFTVQMNILHHRIAAIEEEVGIKFKQTYGEQESTTGKA